MEENKNNTQKQPEQKKKKKSDVLLTIALIVAIAVFCYAAFNLYHIYTEYKKAASGRKRLGYLPPLPRKNHEPCSFSHRKKRYPR